MRILVVDDDRGTVHALRAGLMSRDHEVLIANDGYTALEELENASMRRAKVDLLITDYRMAGMSGLDLVRAARERQRSLPIIVMSAYGDSVLRRTLGSIDKCRYLDKPFGPEALTCLIDGFAPDGGGE